MQNYTNNLRCPLTKTIDKLLIIMKLSLILTLCTCLAFASNVRSQEARVSLHAGDAAMSTVLKNIEKATGYRFVYNNLLFPVSEKVNVNYNNEKVNIVLQQLLQNTGFTFKMLSNDLIVIAPVKDQQTAAVVTGVVTDDKDVPLPGVTVTVKGARFSQTSTNNDGRYTIQVPDANSSLVFSFVGFATQEIPISGRSAINVKLTEAFGALKEIVVVGYGQQSKNTLTGSVAAVSGAELAKVPTPNFSQMLAGRLPGLIATQTSGRPGQDNETLLIRGLSSTNDNSPLIVVDGIPRSNFQANSSFTNGITGGAVTVNAFAYIDPNDIESVSILKDAAATAIYGARAANGAILITTKRGNEGAASISYTGNFASQDAVNIIKPVDSYNGSLMWNQAWKNEGTFAPTAGGSRGFTDAAIEALRTGSDPNRYANTDWYSTVFANSAYQTSHNISANGGGAKNKYFVSGGYFNQNGLYKGVGLKRYNLRTNLDGKVSDRIDYTLNISGRIEKNPSTATSPQAVLYISPVEPIQYTNGTYHYVSATQGNPYLDARGDAGTFNIENTMFESSGSLSYKIPGITGLTAKGLMSFDKYLIDYNFFKVPYTTYVYNDNNTYSVPASVSAARALLSEVWSQFQSLTYEASLNYNHSFKNHNITALLLYTQTQNEGESLSGRRSNFSSSTLGELNLGSTTGQTNAGTGYQNARRGIVGRLGYNFKGKYLAEFSFREDGSDLFPEGHRYGFFPAVSAGWRLSEEPFIKQALPFINNLKVRGSWGQAGNDKAAAFQYLNNYTISTSAGYSFGGTAATANQTLNPTVIANTNFTWEKATTTNIGLDANLWNNLLGITADYFYRRTSNVLASNTSAIPLLIGGTVSVGNYGIVDNSGFELELTHENTVGKVHYYLRPNVTFNKSKVVYYPDAASTPAALKLTGKPVSPDAITGYVAHGLYQSQAEITAGPTPLYPTTKPGDIKYEDTNGDGKITADDRVIISRGATPGVIFGLSGGASFKNFDCNFLFQGATNVDKYISIYLSSSFVTGLNVAYPFQQDYWTPDNPGALFPRPLVSSPNNQQSTSYWLRNGSYVRLKSLDFGYTLPSTISKKAGMSNVRFFVSGTNLFTLSHLKGIMDPEGAVTNYPLVKVYNAGLSVKF